MNKQEVQQKIDEITAEINKGGANMYDPVTNELVGNNLSTLAGIKASYELLLVHLEAEGE